MRHRSPYRVSRFKKTPFILIVMTKKITSGKIKQKNNTLEARIEQLLEPLLLKQIFELPPPINISFRYFQTFLEEQERQILRPFREKMWKLYALQRVLFSFQARCDDRSMGMPPAEYERINAEEEAAILSRIQAILTSTTPEIDSNW